MKLIILVAILFLSGCDTIQGIRMPVSPSFDQSCECAVTNLEESGYSSKIDEVNQLSVSKNDKYLFSVYPSESGVMKMYLYSLNSPLPCDHANQAYEEMRNFLQLLENSCGYKPSEYSVSFECSSNKARQNRPAGWTR